MRARASCLWLLLVFLPGLAGAGVLRLAVSRGPVSLPVYVADAMGYFKREGVDVQLQDCTSGRDCFRRLTEGAADLATAAELLVALDSFRPSDVAIIATISSSTHHIKLVARHSAGVRVPGDLRGKRVATVSGSSAQYFLDSWLVFHEIDPAEVQTVPLAPEQLGAALQHHEVDAVAIWEPVASAAAGALGADARVLPNPRVYTQHFTLVTGRPTIAARRADLTGVLRALQHAERLITEQPAQARALLSARLHSSSDADLMAEHDYRLQLQQSLIATLEGEARWAVRNGHATPSAPGGNLLRCIDASLLRGIAPLAVSLVR